MRVLKAILLALALCVPTSMPAYALGGGGAGPGGGGGDRESGGSGSSNRMFLTFSLFGGNSDDEYSEEESERDEDPRVILMPAVVVPLSVNDRLSGFAYVHLRVRLQDGANIWDARENLHYALDLLVRAGHRANLSNADGTGLDFERAEEVWTGTLGEFYGGNALDWVEVSSADTRLVRR